MKKKCEPRQLNDFHCSLCNAVEGIGKSFLRRMDDGDDDNSRPVLLPKEATPLLF